MKGDINMRGVREYYDIISNAKGENKMISCRVCELYRPKDLTGMSLLEKSQSVSGFCMDSNNPDFNEWAREFGRGIGRFESYITPKWCSKRKNPKKTEEYYSKEEIREFVAEEKERIKTIEGSIKYVAVTDRGYIKGDNYQGIEFVTKENARQFTNEEVHVYGRSIAADMFDFYKCSSLWFEKV